MKSNKRLLALVLGLTMIFVLLIAIPAAAENEKTFLPTVKGDNIFGIPQGTTTADLAERLPKTIIGLKDLDGEAAEATAKIGTGFSVVLNGNDFVAVVEGDVNGDGELTAQDYLIIKRYYLGTHDLTNSAFVIAAKGEGQDRMKAVRYLMVKRSVTAGYNMNSEYTVPYFEPEDDESGWTDDWV